MAAPQEDKVMHAVHFDPDFSDDERREKLYAGDIVILSPAGTEALVALAREMLEEAFTPYDPRVIHRNIRRSRWPPS